MKVNGTKVKKVVLLMALLAPMIYLFGTLFEALKGANGEQVLAEPVYVEQYVPVDNLVFGNDYKLVVNSASAVLSATDFVPRAFDAPFSYNGRSYGYLRCGYSVDRSATRFYITEPFVQLASYQLDTQTYSGQSLPASLFFFDVNADFLAFFEGFDYELFVLASVPSSQVVLSPSSYSDYLFNNFFAKNNFLSVSGRKVLDGEADYGFKPAGDLIRFVDGTMFHLANVEYGALVIGYMYYAFHVVCVFLIFNLLMFFPHLIENIYEKFERGW